MAYLATNLKGAFGVPGFGVFPAGATLEVPQDIAAWLADRPEFIVRADTDDFALRDQQGRVRFIGYAGPVDSRFGYGSAGITILRALTKLGVVARVQTGYNNSFSVAYRHDLPEDAAAQLTHRPFLPQVDLVHSLPSELPYSNAPRKIAWTMWETSKIPDGTVDGFGDWAALINRYAERLVVPCRHNADVFADCGVTLPITVLPYGLDTEVWPFYQRPERDTFTIVQFGDLSARKGPVEAVEAFQRAFPTEQNVRLVLKTALGRFNYGSGFIPKFADPRVIIIDQVWSRAQLVQWLHSADAFIWLSRGEGFGLPPLQAALTGLPVIMTTHTGMAEYYKPEYFYGVSSAGTSQALLGGEWFEPDIEHAAAQLREVYEHRAAALQKGKRAAVYVKKYFSVDAFAKRLQGFLETL